MIYVDNNSTTKIAPEVLREMEPFLNDSYGNPSSLHLLGQEARRGIENSRERVMRLLGAKSPSEIIFTSGGTESNSLAIRGLVRSFPEKMQLITTQVEHPSVLQVFKDLEKEGYPVVYLGVDASGNLRLEQLKEALVTRTVLVSIMAANNETGVINPIEEIGKLVKHFGAFFHVDATQAAGRIPFVLQKSCIDLLTISGHKIHAPKGIGALYVKKNTPLTACITGGGQERELRAGTENVASIAALGKACDLAAENFAARNSFLANLRDALEEQLQESIPSAVINGDRNNRISNTSNISFPGLDAESLLLALNEEGICASSGSACSTGAMQPSHVLLAMGFAEDRVRGAIRFSLSRYSQEEEIQLIRQKIPSIIHRLWEIQTSGV